VGEPGGETGRLKAEIARSYGLAPVEGWRWIKRGESPAVASLHADGRRLVARLFADEAAAPRAEYVARFMLHLRSVGVEAEEAVRTASGEPSARLPSGVTVVLSRFYADPPMTLPLGAGGARAWGRYVSELHRACRDWSAPSPLASPWLRREPRAIVERALTLAARFRGPRGILEMASERIIGCWDGAPSLRPVHGDLWPGNLLAGPHGLRAIDFAEAGDGPPAIDLATAFRWMPWRDDPTGATMLWDAWLSGYREIGCVSGVELDSVPFVACLQHLIWMIAEVSASTDEAEASWYLGDHSDALRAILATAMDR
jgi:Ser/Thr protein kinase RdoA (MazF antagonist)